MTEREISRSLVNAARRRLEDLDVAWRGGERRLPRAPAAHEEVVPFLEALKINRTINLGVYRLVCTGGLHELGFKVDDIAATLGVSARHARRLIAKDPVSQSPRQPTGGRRSKRVAFCVPCALSFRPRAFGFTSG